eukprot:Clim_evm1s53 gene=Clim_evmTU1s53
MLLARFGALCGRTAAQITAPGRRITFPPSRVITSPVTKRTVMPMSTVQPRKMNDKDAYTPLVLPRRVKVGPYTIPLDTDNLPYVLGTSGLIPFVSLSVLSAGLPLSASEIALNGLVTYSASILSFMGAVHWGVALSKWGGGTFGSLPTHRVQYCMSVVPPLIAWASLMMPHTAALMTQSMTFGALLAFDQYTVSQGTLPNWYMNLRVPLTVVVIMCLLVSYSTALTNANEGKPRAKPLPQPVKAEKKVETKTPEAKKVETKKQEPKKEEAKKPEAKKPEVKKEEAKKPESKKEEAKKSEAPSSTSSKYKAPEKDLSKEAPSAAAAPAK